MADSGGVSRGTDDDQIWETVETWGVAIIERIPLPWLVGLAFFAIVAHVVRGTAPIIIREIRLDREGKRRHVREMAKITDQIENKRQRSQSGEGRDER